MWCNSCSTNIEQEIEASKANFDRIASVRLAKPICENNEISDGKELIEKLPSFAKDIELNITAISQEQFKDPVIQTVRQLLESGNKDEKNVKFRQSKAMKTYLNNFENLCLIGNISCIKQPTEDPNIQNIKICAPLSLFLKIFDLAHQDLLSGHSGKDKTLSSIKRFFYWPGLYKWVSHLIANCLDCQKNKQKRKDLNEAPLEEWTETVPFPFDTVHIDHKGPINPPSNGNKHCLVVIDSFSRYIQVYPVSSTSASETISALEKLFLTFGIPQKLVYDKGSAFMIEEFTIWTHELGITHAPSTAYSPWTNEKVEIQNKHLGTHFRIFFEQANRNWSDLAPKFAFAPNTTANTSTGTNTLRNRFWPKAPNSPFSEIRIIKVFRFNL